MQFSWLCETKNDNRKRNLAPFIFPVAFLAALGTLLRAPDHNISRIFITIFFFMIGCNDVYDAI